MYSFGPLPRQTKTGRVIGTHQKIDRVARRHMNDLLSPKLAFPGIRDIIHFEGSRGPDALHIKSPNIDEPVHFINPASPDGELLDWIRRHSGNLTDALAAGDEVRASFEAAWLAHTVTDGLTPAHHEPYHEQLEKIKRTEEEVQGRVKDKMLMRGDTRRELIRNNWQYWGAKGLMTTHTLFEAGVAVAAKPYKFEAAVPSADEIEHMMEEGFEHVYLRLVAEVDSLGMYEEFKRTGWTSKLARQTNSELLPRVIMAVILAWHDAYTRALKEVA